MSTCECGHQGEECPPFEAHPVLDTVCTSNCEMRSTRPPPKSFKNHRRLRTDLQVCSGFLINVSTAKPHRILSASDSFIEFVGYTRNELVGRSISTLQGPLSDAGLLESGICEAWKLDLKSFSLTLYSRSGLELVVDVQCLPFADSEGKMTGTTLQMQLLSDERSGMHSEPLVKEPPASPSSRCKYNAFMGLHLQEEIFPAHRAGGALFSH